MSMGSTLTCPRCKRENTAEAGFCERCGFGLDATASLSAVKEDSSISPENWIDRVIAGKYRILSVLGGRVAPVREC